MGRTYLPANDRVLDTELLHMVPCVSAVMGSVAGLPAVQAAGAIAPSLPSIGRSVGGS